MGEGVGEGVGVCAPAETVSIKNKKTDTRDFLIIVEFNFLSDDYRDFVFYRRVRLKETIWSRRWVASLR